MNHLSLLISCVIDRDRVSEGTDFERLLNLNDSSSMFDTVTVYSANFNMLFKNCTRP